MKDKKLKNSSKAIMDFYALVGAGALMFTAVVGLLSYLVVVDD